YSDLLTYNPNDPNFQTDIQSQFQPNIVDGLNCHNEKTYFGLSVANFLTTTRYDDNIQSTMQQKMHYYLMGGHVIDINPTLKFKPAFLLTAVSGAPLQADASANFLIQYKFMVSGAYRLNAV